MDGPHQGRAPAMTRRGFLRKGAATVASASAFAAALSPLRDLVPGDVPSWEEFLQKHYKEMTAPLVDFYSDKGILANINANAPLETIVESVIRELG